MYLNKYFYLKSKKKYLKCIFKNNKKIKQNKKILKMYLNRLFKKYRGKAH